VKYSVCEELGHVFYKCPKCQREILLGDFSVKICKEDIFKTIIRNESLHEICNDNGVRVVNSATSENLTVKSTMFPYRNVHKYTRMSSDRKEHSYIDHTLIDRRMRWNLLVVRSFRVADCDTDHYLVVAKVREGLTVNKDYT
jgi:hypothetical protein